MKLTLNQSTPMWRSHELKSRYDVVIIGAGVHGLATAYYLCKKGINRVAVLDKRYLGGGNSGRNTAILRANYRTFEGVPFYDASLKLYKDLTQELDFNILFSEQGHLTLAHTDSAVVSLRLRADVNELLGVKSRLIYPDEIKKLVPTINIDRQRYPIKAALYHLPGAVVRHDAVVWGYARGIDRLGGEIHTHTEVQGIRTEKGEVKGAKTNRGEISAPIVVNATSGWCSTISDMVGVKLPVVSHPLQACVTEPIKPILDKIVVSANLHVYIYQTDRGELVIGSEIDPYASYSLRSTLPTLEGISARALQLFPFLENVNVLRQWTGTCDMTPDYSPIIGTVPNLNGFVLDVGWGTYGFKAGPIAGRMVAELIATGNTPDLIKPFSLSRFSEGVLVGEKAAAAVSH